MGEEQKDDTPCMESLTEENIHLHLKFDDDDDDGNCCTGGRVGGREGLKRRNEEKKGRQGRKERPAS